jgi:general secretion pathway protein N
MTRSSLIAIGFGAYVFALIVIAPATIVDAGLSYASNGRLRLAEARGTLWSGSGLIEIRDLDGQSRVVKNLAWRFRLDAALRGLFTYEVEFGYGYTPFPVTIFWSRIELKNADIQLPAAALGIGIPKLAAMELAGDLNLHIASLSLGRSATLGSATVQWLAAGSTLSPISPFGNYELRLNGNGSTVHATLHTLQGPLQLDGQGSWASGHSPVFSVLAHAPPPFQQRFEPFLRLISIERDAGRFELQLK